MKITSLLTAFLLIFNFSVHTSCALEAPVSSDREYIVSPDDIIEITVYGEPDLSATVRISQDGTIIYPLLGNIRAAGLTVRELERNITELLGEDYLITPQVSVFIRQYGKISILGAVGHPGAYEAKEKLTITQVIALAGGFTDDADTTNVKIIRTNEGRRETLEVDVSQILDKAAGDIEIMPKDTIMVEEYGRFSIMGQVMKPGVYTLKKNLMVTEAIIIAGGFTPAAAKNGTKLIREQDGKKIVINIPVSSIGRSGDSSKDTVVKPGDTIVVPESFF